MDEIPDAITKPWALSLTVEQVFIDALMLVSVAKVRHRDKLSEAEWVQLLLDATIMEWVRQ